MAKVRVRKALQVGERYTGSYNGHARGFEVLAKVKGIDGKPQVLTWQEDGGSASGGDIPGYRRFRTGQLSDVQPQESEDS